jgi:GMP synthase (glutamine-hydrolysing)
MHRRIHCIQHSERVRPLDVERWAASREVDLVVVRADLGELPAPDEIQDLIVLGGEMNTDQREQHPWLDQERALLTALIARDEVRIFGICLGSQLLAEVLGGHVARAEHREIGWHRVDLTEAGRNSRVFGTLAPSTDVFEWHGDSWALPAEATLTMAGSTCTTQAFEWKDRVFAVQFHPEFTYARTTQLAATTTDDLDTGEIAVQTAEQFLADPAKFDASRDLLDSLLDAAFH